MADITQKLIDSEGLIELQEGEHFDPLRLTRSREVVSVFSGGVSVLMEPTKNEDGPWQLMFLSMIALFGTEEGYFVDDSSRIQYVLPIEPFSRETTLFRSGYGTVSKLTHVHVSCARITPRDI